MLDEKTRRIQQKMLDGLIIEGSYGGERGDINTVNIKLMDGRRKTTIATVMQYATTMVLYRHIVPHDMLRHGLKLTRHLRVLEVK